ncbi:MAG: helix-turn-helix transcriptional regulator [Verrucomicrobia bacterium]|nr:helix-turn-helix transcriptional regulator [Verrucomicrobiota bacterium]
MKPETFKAWRTKLGYTQEEAAEKFKVSRVTVANWEAGTTIPYAVEQLCNVYEIFWKMRDDFGPVTLVFGNGAMFVDPYRPNVRPVKPLQHEPYRTNAEAIAKACQIMDTCQTMYIVDENDDVIWNGVKLRDECTKRRLKVKKRR